MRITTDPASPKPGLGKRLWWFAGIYIVSVAVFAAAAFVLEALLPH